MICKLSRYTAPMALLFLAVTPSFSFAQHGSPSKNKPVVSTPAVSHTAILPGAQAASLFPKGTQFWTPTAADIAQLETALSALAKKTTLPYLPPDAKPRSIATDYCRQYIGIIQGGKKMIYVNAFSAGIESEFPHWRQQPAIVSDGGSGFYHTTYDVKAHKFSEVRFNGLA